MMASGYQKDDFIFQGVWYYINQCQNETSPFDFLSDYQESLHIFQNQLQEYSFQLQQEETTCSNDDTDEIRVLLEMLSDMSGSSKILETLSKDLFWLLRCDDIVAPMYVDPIYDATCTHSMRGVTWAFASFLIVAFAGMMMITLRASWAPLRPKEEEEDQKDDAKSDDGYHDEPPTTTGAENSEPVEQKSQPIYQGIVGQEEPAKQYAGTVLENAVFIARERGAWRKRGRIPFLSLFFVSEAIIIITTLLHLGTHTRLCTSKARTTNQPTNKTYSWL